MEKRATPSPFHRKATLQALALYQQHVLKWSGCQLCSFGQNGGRKIHFRGMLPAELLFIGDAGDESEHSLGMPFVDPTAKRLTDVIESAFQKLNLQLPWCMANAVLCSPLDVDGSYLKPKSAQLTACRSRLLELISIVSPTVIIRVGGIAKKAISSVVTYTSALTGKLKTAGTIDIYHPSWISRQNDEALAEKKIVYELIAGLKEFYEPAS